MKKEYSLTLHNSDKTLEYLLEEHCYTIGRNSTCTICIPKNYISGIQCTLVWMPTDIYYEDYRYVLIDGCVSGKASRNGTWIKKKASAESQRIGEEAEVGQSNRRLITYFLEDQDTISFSKSNNYPYLTFNILKEGGNSEDQDSGTTSGYEFG